jgi:hypothetical protein
VERNGAESFGSNPRDGRTTWNQEDELICPVSQLLIAYAVTRAHLVVLQSCKGKNVVLEVQDPRTGGIGWRRELGQLKSVVLSVTPDLIGVGGKDHGRPTMTFFDDSGERLAAATVSEPAFKVDKAETVGRSGNTLYFSSEGALYALRVGGSAPLWRRSLTQERIPAAMFGNGLIVAFSTGGDSPYNLPVLGRPSESAVADLQGRREVLPLPGGGVTLGAIGDLVITERDFQHSTLLTALRLTYRETVSPGLGGVKPTDWPAACALLSAGQLAEINAGYERIPVQRSRNVFGVELPQESSCDFAIHALPEKSTFKISVQWVAGDEISARLLAQGDLPWYYPDSSIEVIGPDTYLYRTGVANHEDVPSAVIVAVGRQVFMVSGRDADVLVRVAGFLRARQS